MLGRPCGWRSSLVFVPADRKNLELAPVVALRVLDPLDGIVLDAEERPQPLRQFLLRLLHVRPGVGAVLIDLATGVREAFQQFPLLGRVTVLAVGHAHLGTQPPMVAQGTPH